MTGVRVIWRIIVRKSRRCLDLLTCPASEVEILLIHEEGMVKIEGV